MKNTNLITKNFQIILHEIKLVFEKFDEKNVIELMRLITSSKTIITCGAGRMGLITKALSTRLGHMGYRSYAIGDSTVPNISMDDLLIVASGSGETETMYAILKKAKHQHCKIALITSRQNSKMSKIADIKIILHTQSKVHNAGVRSIQPMTTLMEQCTYIFFDALVLELINQQNITNNSMWQSHSNLE